MTATIIPLLGAATQPVMQTTKRNERLHRMAELIAERSRRRGNACTVAEALVAVHGTVARMQIGR